VYSLVEKWSSGNCDRKARMDLPHSALGGGGKRLGHVIAVDWKWVGGKVKDHVSMDVSRFEDESLIESIVLVASGEFQLSRICLDELTVVLKKSKQGRWWKRQRK
jgi:hypothetical protein